MWNFFRRHWDEMKRSRPGHRFLDHYERNQKKAATGFPIRKIVVIFAALVAFVVAFILMFIPGPAVLFYFIGGALLASEFRFVAVGLDKLEVKLRLWFKRGKAWWSHASWPLRILALVGGGIVAVGFLAGTYALMHALRS